MDRHSTLKARGALLAVVFAMFASIAAPSPASADIGIGDPPPPLAQVSSGHTGNTGSGAFSYPCPNSVCIAQVGSGPRYVPYPPSYGYYRWKISGEGSTEYADCSLFYEVWRFTGPISNPTETTTVSHIVQPDPCNSGTTRPASIVSPNPHDTGRVASVDSRNVLGQAATTGVGAPWEGSTYTSIETGRIGVTTPLTDSGRYASTIGATPPFRWYTGGSCMNYQTGTHAAALADPRDDAWVGRDDTSTFRQNRIGDGYRSSCTSVTDCLSTGCASFYFRSCGCTG